MLDDLPARAQALGHFIGEDAPERDPAEARNRALPSLNGASRAANDERSLARGLFAASYARGADEALPLSSSEDGSRSCADQRNAPETAHREDGARQRGDREPLPTVGRTIQQTPLAGRPVRDSRKEPHDDP